MTIENQRIHQNRKTNNQNKPRINLIVDEYDGETRSHDKSNYIRFRHEKQQHISTKRQLERSIRWMITQA